MREEVSAVSKELRMLVGVLKMSIFITFLAGLMYLAQVQPEVFDRAEMGPGPIDPTYAVLQW